MLRNLRNCEKRKVLDCGSWYSIKLWGDLYGKESRSPDREIVGQVVHLALEAFRREEISSGKMRDLCKLLGVPARELLQLAEAT